MNSGGHLAADDLATDNFLEQQRLIGMIVLLLPKIARKQGGTNLLKALLNLAKLYAAKKG